MKSLVRLWIFTVVIFTLGMLIKPLLILLPITCIFGLVFGLYKSANNEDGTVWQFIFSLATGILYFPLLFFAFQLAVEYVDPELFMSTPLTYAVFIIPIVAIIAFILFKKYKS